MSIPHETISAFLSRYRELGTINNLLHPGRSRKITESDNRYIVRTAESSTRIPMAELRVDTNINVSEQTLRRRLRDSGIRKWKAVNRPFLTKIHAAKRLQWAKKHQDWIREQWECVIWSDECAVKKNSDTKQVWVFRRQTKSEKYNPKNVQPKARDGDVSQMVWGCFIGKMLGPIALIDGTVNTILYIDILTEKLVPFIDAIALDGTTNTVFQQDNASSHVSKKAREWLQTSALAHGYTIMNWPPNSPDMNLIEHLWKHLKQELHQQYPDTFNLRGSLNVVRTKLKERLTEIWWKIGEGILDTLVESMPRRVQALIAAKGWYTKY